MQGSGPLPNNTEVFTSWKEIASYLNKGVRTVQRWEAEFGLPVRRPRGRSRGIVQASRVDLDRWLNSKWALRAERALATEGVETRINQNLQLNRKLVTELGVSLQKLQNECNSLRQQIEVSRKPILTPNMFPPERISKVG